jgi:hypothetical protein
MVLVVSRHLRDQVAEGSVWTGFLWSRMGFSDLFVRVRCRISGSIVGGGILDQMSEYQLSKAWG